MSRNPDVRMCPCGNCHLTWDEAVRAVMAGPAALSRDQAEARMEEVARMNLGTMRTKACAAIADGIESQEGNE